MEAAADAAEDGGPGSLHVRARHIKKRALKNKSLAVSFNEKDLKDYVTGFHKRKKKRRKEALQQQEEAERRKRIELRKKIKRIYQQLRFLFRKMERDFVQFGETPADSGSDGAGSDEEHGHDEDDEPVASVSGMMTYDNGDMQVIVKTSEISREEDNPVDRSEVVRSQSDEAFEKSKKQNIPATRKKLINRAPKKRSRPKPQSKREKRKGKMKNSRPN